MITHSKDQFFYLFISAVAAYVGMWFSNIPEHTLLAGKYLFFTPFVILFFNSSLVYLIALKWVSDKQRAFFLALIYIVAPLHLDSFLFPSQWQAFLAEFFMLLSCYFWLMSRESWSMMSLIISMLLNVKLAFLGILVSICLRLKNTYKIFLCATSFSILIFTAISFYQRDYFFEEQLSSLSYVLLTAVSPLSMSSLNRAVLIPNYLSTFMLLFWLSTIGIAIFGLFLKKGKLRFIGLIWLSLFLGSFLAAKEILGSGGFPYFFLPTSYSLILPLFLIFINSYLDLLKNSKIQQTIIAFIVLVWSAALISWERTSMDYVKMWKEELAVLPESYEHELEVKLTYAQLLMKKELYDDADKFIQLNKLKFPVEDWYQMLLTIYSSREDEVKFKQVYEEMIRNKVPYKPAESN